ncbi:MAG: ribonuclease Y, partial [Fusobacteriaceae bacterium]
MTIILGVGLIVIGVCIFASVIFKKSVLDVKIKELNNLEDETLKAKIKAKEILEFAEKEASAIKKEAELKAKEIIYSMKEEAEKEIK